MTYLGMNVLHSGVLSPRVNVLECGYKWNGEVYPTLTHISWKATGYQIGGNNFFGPQSNAEVNNSLVPQLLSHWEKLMKRDRGLMLEV